MPIRGVIQREILWIDENVRLKKNNQDYEFALRWYEDADTVYLVDGKKEPYNLEKLKRMYDYLDRHGELYFIEIKSGDAFIPIGDVTFWQTDMPIVIGDLSYRGKGIGKRIINRLIERGHEIGFDSLYADKIYKYNTASQKAFEGAGFVLYEETPAGYRYRYDYAK